MMENPLLSAQPAHLVVAIHSGVVELRIVGSIESLRETLQAQSVVSVGGGGSFSVSNPEWPSAVDVIYGWRGLIQPLFLRTSLASGAAEYEVPPETLSRMNLLGRSSARFYVKRTVVARVDFGDNLILVSEPFEIGQAGPVMSSKDYDGSSSAVGSSDLSTSRITDQALLSHNRVGESKTSSSSSVASRSSQQQQSQTQGAAAAASRAGLNSSPTNSEFEESGWDETVDTRRCVLGCCTPCYSTCHCLWHVGRSTPASALLAMGLAVAAVLVEEAYLPPVRDELDAAGMHIEQQLFDFLRCESGVSQAHRGVMMNCHSNRSLPDAAVSVGGM